MTVVYPDRIYSAKKQVWQWLPAVANPSAGPTVAEWTAGLATQIHYEADQMQFTASAATQEAQRYSDQYSTITPGRKKIEIPDVEVYTDPQQPDSTTYALAKAWKAEPIGFLALRAGIDADTAAAAAQNVSVLVKVKIIDMLLRAPNPSDAGDFYRHKFQVLPQGDPISDVKLTA